MKERLLWPDYVRAFAIWLMVIGHSNVSLPWLQHFIFIFHMPVFFVIAGFFDKDMAISSGFLKKQMRVLIIPYFFFSLCNFLICWVSPYLHPELYPGQQSWTSIFASAFVGMFLMVDRVTPYSFMPNLALWFLPALFIVKMVMALGTMIFRGRWIISCSVITSMALVLSCFIPISSNVFSYHSAILGLPFYIFGFLLKKSGLIERLQNYISVTRIFPVVALFYLFFVGLKNGVVSIDACCYGNNIFLFYINGIIGSLMCIMSSLCIRRPISWLLSVGQSTLTILGLHGFFVLAFKVLFVLMDLDVNNLPIFCSIIIGCVACACCTFIHKFLLRLCPIAVGK